MSDDRIDVRRRVLFLCGRNRRRSPTAERIFRRSPELSVRARGLSASAARRVTAADVRWADVIFVMEGAQKDQLVTAFGRHVGARPVHVLDIPDEYAFLDLELVELLTTGVSAILGIDSAEE